MLTPIFYAVLSCVVGNLINRISWHLYGNYNLTGRSIIWDFVNSEIVRRPLLGWGYQSFWLGGPVAPSIVNGPRWVKTMPSSQNGYLDTTGHEVCWPYLFCNLHLYNPPRHWPRPQNRSGAASAQTCFQSYPHELLETGWMHGYDMLWLMFLIVTAETGQYWQHSPSIVSEPMRPSSAIAARPCFARAQVSHKLGRFQKRCT